MFATGMMLESAQRGSVAPEVRNGVGRAVDELDVTIQEIRTAIKNLVAALREGLSNAFSLPASWIDVVVDANVPCRTADPY